MDEVIVETEASAREEDPTAKPLAHLRHRDAVITFTTVDLTSPGSGWNGRTLPAASSPQERLVAFGQGQRDELDAVFSTLAQVRRLAPGEGLRTDDVGSNGRMVMRRTAVKDYRATTYDLHHRA